jgi:hypothetical protein
VLESTTVLPRGDVMSIFRGSCYLLILGMAVFGLQRLTQRIDWLGSKPFNIHFAVIDAKTRAPVPFARIRVEVEGGGWDYDVQRAASFATDEKGEFTNHHDNCFCGGRDTFWKSTHYVRLPRWYITARAPGYQTINPPIYLETMHYRRQTDFGGDIASLNVTLELSRPRPY